MTVFLRVFDATYWRRRDSILEILGILSTDTAFVTVNPLTIAAQGGNKLTTLDPHVIYNQMRTLATAPDVSVSGADDYLFANWSANGWDVEGDFLSEARVWTQNNFANIYLNPIQNDLDLLMLYGKVGEQFYALPLIYIGNNGDTDFPIDGGSFTNHVFSQTVDSGTFDDTVFDTTIDGGNF